MKFLLSFIVLLFSCINGFSHDVTLLDSITRNPLVYATIYEVNGNIVGVSDINGEISLKKGQKYIISHVGYGTKNIVCDENKTIVLVPISHEIPEISVSARKKKYYHCKVFFRSIEHVDSCLKYYFDGMAEYFISTKNGKVKKRFTVEHYSKSNKPEIAQKVRTFMLSDRHIGLPNINKNSLYEEIVKDKHRRIESDIVFGDTTHIGRCVTSGDDSEIILSTNALYPRTKLTIKIFGYTQELTENDRTEIYKTNEFHTPTLFDLKSSSIIRHFTLTHKKEDFTRQIDVNDEFFVVEHDYTDEIQPSSNQQLQEDYKKYSEIFPLDERIKKEFISLDEVWNCTRGSDTLAQFRFDTAK